MTTQTTFSCRFCGRVYPLQSSLMGRAIRCKCGRPITVPGVRQKTEPRGKPVDEGNFLRCPRCESRIAVGEHVCGECNFNLRTGQIEHPHEPDVEPASPAAPSLPSAVRNPQTELYEQQQKRTTLLLAGAFVILVIATIVGIRVFNRAAAPEETPVLPGEDALVIEMMETEGHREASEWLSVHPSRMFSGMTRAQADDRVRMLYAMGARRVIAFGSGVTGAIAIELPDDAQKRNELFEWQARWHRQIGRRVATDVGQKYLLIRLGI